MIQYPAPKNKQTNKKKHLSKIKNSVPQLYGHIANA
jgi:hypothetical protein